MTPLERNLLAALRDLITYADPDSVEDQKNDVRLRQEAEEAWGRACAAVANAEKQERR